MTSNTPKVRVSEVMFDTVKALARSLVAGSKVHARVVRKPSESTAGKARWSGRGLSFPPGRKAMIPPARRATTRPTTPASAARRRRRRGEAATAGPAGGPLLAAPRPANVDSAAPMSAGATSTTGDWKRPDQDAAPRATAA